MYKIIVMIFTFSIRDFGHPQFLKSQFGHPVIKILAKSLNPSMPVVAEKRLSLIKAYFRK